MQLMDGLKKHSQHYFYNNFLQMFAHFQVKFLDKFEAAKIGRKVIFALDRCEGVDTVKSRE